MRSSLHTFRSGLALIALACTLMALPAAASAQTAPAPDLRSPDTRDASLKPVPVDLRSPDTRDVAEGYHPTLPAGYGIAVRSQAQSAGFDWADALVGAAAALGLTLLAVAGVLLARRHAHGDRTAVA
jgi:hypothetical protein